MNNFLDTKEKYISLREDERKIIITHLRGKGFEVSTRGGSGKSKYTNDGLLEKSYDLRNWKWVEAIKDDEIFFVSLQAFDKDEKSNNYHVLMDRIGICKYDKNNKKPDYFNLMQTTTLELPLEKKDLNKLVEIMDKMTI